MVTVKDLRKYRAICAEIHQIESKLTGSRIHVKDSVKSAAKHPYSVHNVPIEGDVYESSSPALLAKFKRLLWERGVIEDFISSIPEYKVRRALEIYCLEPLGEDMEAPSWEKVADALADGSTGDSIRKSVERFLKK